LGCQTNSIATTAHRMDWNPNSFQELTDPKSERASSLVQFLFERFIFLGTFFF
jgi:hypothetical protein